mgnify:CR=1 FL=1
MKKFPIAIQRKIDEINEMLPKINEAEVYPTTYAGGTIEKYILLLEPIEIKNQYVYICEKLDEKMKFGFEKRYNVNDNRDEYESINGRKSLMYELGIIKRAFKKALKG